ncbi:SRPBCC domain-containing protein [Nonomuraea sp. M3C6]|uniref:SRPBCC domain-containing protein n=1 Tax=Nonomuraea marmarensis TaxID=3351344 RepID=A0ABW7A6T4_9ACTN
MSRQFEVRWEGVLPAPPQEAWDGITRHAVGWLWKTEYEPWAGGAERGLTGRGTVTAWDPPRHFATRAPDLDGFNQLDYLLEPHGQGTYLRYHHQGEFPEDDYDVQLDACRQHTEFYHHSLGEYLRHFSGREAVYVSAEAPDSSAKGGSDVVRRALGVPDGVAAGDRIRLTPAGLAPIDGVVDYVTDAFLGVRSADALFRVYGRDVWGWPVSVVCHLFADGAAGQDWGAWLRRVFADEGVA